MAVVRGYRADLDGVRALAIVEVICFHFESGVLGCGAIGVDIFFVLSGYLITGLLLAERAKTGSVNLRDFYLRRIFRLFPALLALLTVGAVAIAVELPGHRDHGLVLGGVIAVLYLTDIVAYTHSVYWEVFVWTWSLSLEEQFYLVWPTLLRRASGSRRNVRMLAIGAAVVALVLAEVFAHNGVGGNQPKDYYEPQAHAFALLIGCAAATVEVPRWFRHLALPALLGLVALGQFPSTVPASSFLRLTIPATAVLTAVLILGLEHSPRITSGLLGLPPIARIGAISYGLYLYHPIVYAVVSNRWHPQDHWKLVVLCAVITYLVAEVSYRLYESPLRRVGRSWIARRFPDPHPVGGS